MILRALVFVAGLLALFVPASAQTRILFDAAHAQSAGNADWVIDADTRNLGWTPNGVTGAAYTGSNPQQIPTPGQSGITAATSETYWDGALSAWAVDCVKRGYVV